LSNTGEPPAGGDAWRGPGIRHDPEHEAQHGTDVRTFLIADVRGYTKYTQEHGDEAAATLASSFAEVVREVVEARDGSLVEVRGDEALVMFVSARQGLRAAMDLQERFRRVGLARGVGIGLDSGEAVPVGSGYRGGALNLAARLCSQAQAGEVLASAGVIHLAAKVDGLAYVDPRMYKLKGYARPVRAMEVVPEDRARAYTRRRRIARRTRRLAARRGPRIAAAVVVIAGIVGAFLPRVLCGGGGSILENDPSGVAILDAKTGGQTGFVSSTQIKSPVGAVYADGHFWVANGDPNTFVEINTKTGLVERQIASPVENVAGFTVHGNDLWVTDGDHPILIQVDIRLRREVNRFPLAEDANAEGGFELGPFAQGSLWLWSAPALKRFDPARGVIGFEFPPLFGQGGTAYDADSGSIWVGGNADGNGLSRIDPKTNAVVATAKLAGTISSFVAGGGYAWVSDDTRGVVSKVDQLGTVVGTYPTGEGAGPEYFTDGTLWVSNQDAGTVSGIDAVTGRQTTYRFRHPLGVVAAGAGKVLVQLGRGRTYEDRIDALVGRTARFLVRAHQLDDADPATANSPLAFEVEFATCASLVRYPDQPSPAGWSLQPEVAAAMPEVAADGRTYTFTIRPGYRFSPPSSQLVTAETFRYSIERALSPKLAPGWIGQRTLGSYFVGDIQGEQAFIAGRSAHISGLRAQGDKLTVELIRYSPDFLERLAMPYFCPLPTDTAIVPGGAMIDAPGNVGAITVPSAGPYYIAESQGGEYTILKRNPNYHGPRPHRLDAIALREGIDPGQAVARVEGGGWDGITNLGDAVMDPNGQVAKQWGPGGTLAAAGGQRYYVVPDGGLSYLDFNAGRPLFSNRSVREAVAYALDRPALARLTGNLNFGVAVGALPTDQLVPPDQPGSVGSVFPVDGPDLQKAKALMQGRHATAILVTNPFGTQPRVAQEIKAELAPIGIDVRIKSLDCCTIEAIHKPGAPYDLKVGGSIWGIGAMAWVEQLLTALPPGGPPLADWSILPPGWESPPVRTLVSRFANERTEADALALLHGSIQPEVPMTGIAYTVEGELFSPRVGCRVFPPASFGVDFAALCATGS